MDELQDFVSNMLSDAASDALTSSGGKEAVAAITAAAVKAASDTAKREVLTMVLPAFVIGIIVAKYVKP